MNPYKALCLGIFLVTASCTKDVGSVNRSGYPESMNAIISNNCSVAGCHNSASMEAAGKLNLETWETMFQGSANGAVVIPYNSKYSPLCYYINTFPELGLQSKPTMPLNKAPLSKQQVETIKSWIDAGAPDKNGRIKWADNPLRKKLYAVNQGCDVVTVIDAATQQPMRYIEVGKGSSAPHQVKVSPDGKFWYVVFVNNNVMKKFRCSDDFFLGDIPLTPLAAGTGTLNAVDWNTFVISKDGKFAYCVSFTSFGLISKIDLENNKLVKVLPGLNFPHGISFNAAEDKIYVASQTGNYFSEIDTSFTQSPVQHSLDQNGQINTFSSLDPHDVILSADGKTLLFTCQKTNEVRVFDLVSNKINRIIQTGVYPQEIIFSAKFNTYYISCSGNGTAAENGVVTAINASAYTAVDLRCGAQPHGISADESTDLLYVLSRNISAGGPPPHHSSQCNGRNGFVNFIDLRTFTFTGKKYELSVDPYFISARP